MQSYESHIADVVVAQVLAFQGVVDVSQCSASPCLVGGWITIFGLRITLALALLAFILCLRTLR